MDPLPPEHFESTPAREENIYTWAYHLVVLTPKEEIMTIVANQMGGWAGKMAITTQTRLDRPAFLR